MTTQAVPYSITYFFAEHTGIEPAIFAVTGQHVTVNTSAPFVGIQGIEPNFLAYQANALTSRRYSHNIMSVVGTQGIEPHYRAYKARALTSRRYSQNSTSRR